MLGRTSGYCALCNRLGVLWSSTSGFSVIDLENDYFLVRFKSEGDAVFALTQGPWTLMGHYLVVQSWNPHFDSSTDGIDSVIAWICLPGMALHYDHKRILRMLGQIIGKVIRIDYESATRGKFARIAVEVTLSKPLVSQFLLDGKVQKVEYENLPNICFGCGKYGHNCESCPDRVVMNGRVGETGLAGASQNAKILPEKGTEGDIQDLPEYGPWMVVSRKGKSRIIKGRRLLVIWAVIRGRI